jgi:ABC-type Fe3+ transport system permease subunit
MPPFVGAVAMQLLFGRNGTVNLLLDDWLGVKIPFMEGLNGVVFVQSVHYFPFILVNLSAALRNIDRSMEEAAQNLGSSGFRLFRRIVFPLALPGYLAGASLVFVKVFDDLATPLLLNVKDMLAPQAYLRVTSIGIADPMGYVISVVLIVASILAMWASAAATRGRDYATVQRGGGGLARRRLGPWESAAGLCGRRADPGARARAASGAPAALVRHDLVLQSAPRRLYARPLHARVQRELGLHQEHPDLCLARRPHRRGARGGPSPISCCARA